MFRLQGLGFRVRLRCPQASGARIPGIKRSFLYILCCFYIFIYFLCVV